MLNFNLILSKQDLDYKIKTGIAKTTMLKNDKLIGPESFEKLHHLKSKFLRKRIEMDHLALGKGVTLGQAWSSFC